MSLHALPSRAPTVDEVEAAWQAFLQAREIAWRSLDIADGIAAGKAFAKFLKLFERT